MYVRTQRALAVGVSDSLYGYSVLKKYGLPRDLCDLVFLHHGIDKVSKWYDIKYLSERALRLHKILKIADIYSAVTTKRSYHSAISHSEAVNLLKTIELMDKDFLKVLDLVPTKRSFGISFIKNGKKYNIEYMFILFKIWYTISM